MNSLGSTIIKVVVTIGTLVFLGLSIQRWNSANTLLHNDQDAVASVKKQYTNELKKKPTEKQVTTDYQKAMNRAKAYLDASNELHASGTNFNKTGKTAFAKMKSMLVDPDDLTGPLYPFVIKNWHATVSYGGENSNGQITMSYKFYNAKDQLMTVYVFNYNRDADKLSGFSNFVTKIGRKAYDVTLLG